MKVWGPLTLHSQSQSANIEGNRIDDELAMATTAPERTLHHHPGFETESRWRPVQALGRGTFGDVHMFRTRLFPTGDVVHVAVKRIKHVFDHPIHLRRAVRELRVMHHLRGHPNIVALWDIDLVSDGMYPGLYCYQEIMDTDLHAILRHPAEVLSEWHAPAVSYQLLCGVHYIHSANIVHRDLKPSNILITRLGVVKICDFGLSRGLIGDDYSREQYTDYVTTRWYRAPEIILGVDCYHHGLDMWAVGCIMAEMVLRKPLFRGENRVDQFHRITDTIGHPPLSWYTDAAIADPCWRDFARDASVFHPNSRNLCPLRPLRDIIPVVESPAFVELLEKILVYEPEHRLTAAQALRSPYFDGIRDTSDPVLTCRTPLNIDFELLPADDLLSILFHEVTKVRESLQPSFL